MRLDVAEGSQNRPTHIGGPIGNSHFASSEDLKRQSAFFADAFMARHLLDAMPGSGPRFTLNLPAIIPEATSVK